MVAGWSGWARSHRLLEPFDLAAGGGVVGSRVLLDDAEPAQFGLEGVAAAGAAGEAGGEHHAVVGEGGGWCAVAGHGGQEGVDHGGAGDAAVGGDRQGVAGVVIEPGQDLDVGAGGQAVVGEVGLPHLIGLLRLKADVGRPGPLAGGRGDQALAAQGAVDRRPRHPKLVVVFEVPADRVRAGVQSLTAEPLAELDDQLDRGIGDGGRGRLGSSGARLERGVALSPVAGHELIHPRAGHPVSGRHLTRAATFNDNSSDHQTGLGHPPTSEPAITPVVDGVRHVSRHPSGMS
jgi:hypothetical protein